MHEEKVRWEQHKNAAGSFKQILETAPSKHNICTAIYLPSNKLSK